MSESAFARRMLEKQGWKEGDGLGKNSDGITKPIKADLKRDKTGVGHNPGEDFTDHWWLRVFNDAASSITKSKVNEVPEVLEKPIPQNKLYQGFRKGSTLMNSGKEHKDSDCSSDDEAEQLDPSELPTLDDLHKFCGGATGSRAAALGIKMGGKRHRAAEQERLFNERIKNKGKEAKNEDGVSGEYQEPVKKKKKKKEKTEKLNDIDTASVEEIEVNENELCDNIDNNGLEKKKRKRSKRKEKTDDVNDNVVESFEESNSVSIIEFEVNENEPCDNIDENGLEKKKRKKNKKKKMEVEEEMDCDIIAVDEIEQKMRSKKRKKVSDCENSTVEETESSNVGDDVKTKKKKKKKHKD